MNQEEIVTLINTRGLGPWYRSEKEGGVTLVEKNTGFTVSSTWRGESKWAAVKVGLAFKAAFEDAIKAGEKFNEAKKLALQKAREAA